MGKRASIARLGEKVSDVVAFPDDATVNDVLTHFGVTLNKGETLAIDGETVGPEDSFNDEEVIYITPSTTGA